MKRTKIIFLAVIATVSFFNSQSIIASMTQFSDLSKQLAQKSKNEGPGFELYNKAPNTIYVINSFMDIIEIAPNNGKFAKDINLNDPISFSIYNQKPSFSRAGPSANFTPVISVTINAPGKTKYLTWNPAKTPSLYPQTGQLMGLLGKSDTGWSLSKNLSQSQIIKK